MAELTPAQFMALWRGSVAAASLAAIERSRPGRHRRGRHEPVLARSHPLRPLTAGRHRA